MITQPSNPFAIWDGKEYQYFTYEIGPEQVPYYLSMGTTHGVICSCILFANSTTHISSKIFYPLIKFIEKYNIDEEYMYSMSYNRLNNFKTILEAHVSNKPLPKDTYCILKPCPTNQFLKVAWASNDTI